MVKGGDAAFWAAAVAITAACAFPFSFLGGNGEGNGVPRIVDGGRGVSLGWCVANDECRRFIFHAEWLRERCQSGESVQLETLQPLHSPHEYEPSRITRAVLRDGILQVKFMDGHESSFEANTLAKWHVAEEKHSVAESLVQTSSRGPPERRLWDSTFTIPEFQHRDLTSPKTQLRLIETLLQDGIALLRGSGSLPGECARVAKTISTLRPTEWGDVFDVKSGFSDTTPGKKDLAYSSKSIGMHLDNVYRDPMPDFQLLHALQHCECEADEIGCSTCSVTNQFADAFAVAEKIRTSYPAYFEALRSVPVRFENDGGGNASAIYTISSIIEASGRTSDCVGAKCIKAVRFSAKSGMYTMKSPGIEAFYEARRLFSQMAHKDNWGMRIHTQLRPGDIILFDNKRILHARSSVAATDGQRHLQGCYLNRDGLMFNLERIRRMVGASQMGASAPRGDRVAFRSLAEGTKEDMDLMTAEYIEACSAKELARRSIDMLKLLDTPDTMLGARVSLYEHSLQTATRAYRANEDEDTIVAALLHDIGELMSPANHGEIVSGILKPYIKPGLEWALRMHEIFQGYHYFHHVGANRTVRDQWKDHKFYDLTVKFCDLYDQTSFDETYDSLPLDFFEPMVVRIFARKSFWWDPSHPKAAAVVAGD